MNETQTEFKQPKQLTKLNFEQETGFPLEFAFMMLTGMLDKKTQEEALQVFNLALRLTGYNGLDDQLEFIKHCKVAYDNFQDWKKTHMQQEGDASETPNVQQ